MAQLNGPNLYSEMAADPNDFAEATVGCAGGAESESGRLLSALFTTRTFSVSVVDDPVGVDLCGCMKNCLTLTCGFAAASAAAHGCSGINTKSAILRRGLAEMERFCVEFFAESHGVSRATFGEACGVGDLYLSCLEGRGQKLAKAFLLARMDGQPRSWEELETELMGGMRLPDQHNIATLHRFLVARYGGDDEAAARFPIFEATHRLAWPAAGQEQDGFDCVLEALRASGRDPSVRLNHRPASVLCANASSS